MPRNQINLYLKPEDREKANRLIELLTAQGIDLRDPKKGGNSISALVRYLVGAELTRQAAERARQAGGE